MQLSIIIVNYKTANLTKQCIKNIVNLSLPFLYEIIVVDSASGDGLIEVLKKKFQDLISGRVLKIIISQKNRGMGAANNLGIKMAQGKYIMILNPDVVVLENSLENLVDFLEKNSQVSCVAPKLLYPNRTYQHSRYRFPSFFLLPAFIRTGLGRLQKNVLDNYFMNNVPKDEAHKIDWARGSALLFRKEDLNQVKGFDERFFMYLEDTDICRRIWQAGKEIWYLPQSQMIHYYARESGRGLWMKDLLGKMAWIHIVSWFKYFWKWRHA